MMNGKYLSARDGFGNGSLAWAPGNVMAQLVSADYRFNEEHQSIDAIGSAAVDTPIELTNPRFVDGWAKCDPMVFRQVRGGTAAAIVFHSATGALIEYHNDIDNFPMPTNGGDVEVAVPEPGIFRI